MPSIGVDGGVNNLRISVSAAAARSSAPDVEMKAAALGPGMSSIRFFPLRGRDFVLSMNSEGRDGSRGRVAKIARMNTAVLFLISGLGILVMALVFVAGAYESHRTS